MHPNCSPLGHLSRRNFHRIQNYHLDLQLPETKLMFKREIQVYQRYFLDGFKGFAVSTLKTLKFKDIISGKIFKDALKNNELSIALIVTLLLITLTSTIGYMIFKNKFPNCISKPALGRYSKLFEAFVFIVCLAILSVAALTFIETTLSVNTAISRNAQLAKDVSADLFETVDIFRDQVADIESNIFGLYYEVVKFLNCASKNHIQDISSYLKNDLALVFNSSAYALGSLFEASEETEINVGLLESCETVKQNVLSIHTTIALTLKFDAKNNETHNTSAIYMTELLKHCSTALQELSMVNETNFKTNIVSIKKKLNRADGITLKRRKLKSHIDELIFDFYNDVIWKLRLNKDRIRHLLRSVRGVIKDVLPNGLESNLDVEFITKNDDGKDIVKRKPSQRLRLCVLLLPSIYIVLTYLMFLVSATSSFYVIHRRHSLERNERLLVYCTLIRKLFQISLLFGSTLLWMMFLCASLAFLMSIPLSVVCRPLVDGTIFTDYLDSTQVWQNKTFLDQIIESNFNMRNQKQIHTKQILEKCFQNSSIFVASGLATVLNMNDCVIGESLFDLLNKNNATIQTYLKVSSIELFDKQMHEYNDIYQAVIIALKAIRINNFTKLTSDIDVIGSSSIVEKLFDLVWSRPINESHINTRKNLQKILIELESIKKKSLPHLKDDIKFILNAENLMEAAKTSLKLCMEYLESLKVGFIELIPKFSIDIREELALILHALNGLCVDLEKGLRNEVGKCYALPLVFENVRWAVCDNAFALVNSIWLTLSISGLIITILLVTGCRMTFYLRCFHEDKIKKKQSIHDFYQNTSINTN